MVIRITTAQAVNYGFAEGAELDAEVARYKKALEAHRLTVGISAPTAHPVIEQIVRNGEQYELLDEEKDEVVWRGEA